MHPSAEIPLIAFTLFAQLAIGIMGVSPLILRGCADTDIGVKIHGQRKMALLFLALAALLSLIHLGTPMHSLFTIFNTGSSWLSKENLLVALTCLTLAGSLWLTWKKMDWRLADCLYYISAGLGIILLYAMSKIYHSPFTPAWAGGQTFFLFLATALLLGSLWLGWTIAYQTALDTAEGRPIMWKIFFCAITGFALMAIAAPFSISSNAPDINPLTISHPIGTLAAWRGCQAFLCGLAVILLALAVWKNLHGAKPARWLFLALLHHPKIAPARASTPSFLSLHLRKAQIFP